MCVREYVCVRVLSVGFSLGAWITMRNYLRIFRVQDLFARINVFPTDADQGRKVSKQFLALTCIWMHIRDAW